MKPMRSNISRFVIPTLLMASLLSFEFASASGAACSLVFSEQSSIDRTIHNLASMRISLDLAKAQGANSIEITVLASDYLKKEQAVVEYLTINEIMTREDFSENLRQTIQKIQKKIQNEKQSTQIEESQKKDEEARRRREHQEHIKNSKPDGNSVFMHRVEPGRFKMGKGDNKVKMKLTKPFEMQATPMTQIVWRAVADLAAQKFPGKFRIKADPSHFKGDTHPVEMVSFHEIQIWIKALNELSAMGETALTNLISDHKKGDVYRLPTEAEWEFVMRGRGQYNEDFYFGSDVTQLGEHAWYQDNSGGQTHPVAQKKPLVMDGKEFYDMYGNVRELVQDWSTGRLPGGVDPQGPMEGDYTVHRSSSWFDRSQDIGSGIRKFNYPILADHGTGFRLARTVPRTLTTLETMLENLRNKLGI